MIKNFPDFQQEYAPLAVHLRNLNLPGVERVESIRDNIAELLKGDASDAANRLGGEVCPLFDDLIWVREVKKAFDNNIEAVIQKANSYLQQIPLLPAAGIPGELITATAPLRELLSEYLGRSDFYACQPEINQTLSALEKVVNAKAAALREEQLQELQTAKEAMQASPEWRQLGAEDQARFAAELDRLQIGFAPDLAGFQKILSDKFAWNTRLTQIAAEIQQIIVESHRTRKVLKKDLSAFPQIITRAEQLQAIIVELEGLLAELSDYEEIILQWR